MRAKNILFISDTKVVSILSPFKQFCICINYIYCQVVSQMRTKLGFISYPTEVIKISGEETILNNFYRYLSVFLAKTQSLLL